MKISFCKGSIFQFEWPKSEDCGYLSESTHNLSSFVPDTKIDYVSVARQGWQKTSMIPFTSRHPLRGRRIDSSDLWKSVMDPLVDLKEPWRSNYHSFLVDLYAYSMAVPKGNHSIDIETIHDRCLDEGPAFAKWLDGYKSYVLGKHCRREYFSNALENEYGYIAINLPESFSVGDVYRSNFLFCWKPERESVTKYSLRPVIYDKDIADEFRQTLREYLDSKALGNIPEVSYKEFLKSSSKGTFDGKNYMSKFVSAARIRGRSRIAFVDRELKGARTACVEELDSVVRIRMIEHNLANILSFETKNGMKLQPGVARRRLGSAMWDKHHVSYCRDFEKEGLTKPRYLLKIMLSELYRRSKFDCFSATDFFDNWVIEENGEVFVTLRGHGLGMCNSLTTLMNIVIEIMVSKLSCNTVDSLYCNDDAAMILKNYDDAISYAGVDRYICEGLGLVLKDKASFISRREVVFCEQFFCRGRKDYEKKLSHNYMGFYNILKCANVLHARELTNSTNVVFIPTALLDDIMQYWGWILFRNEFTRPSNQGGWFRSAYEGVDISYSNVECDERPDRESYAAMMAFQKIKVEMFPWDKRSFKERLYDHFDPDFLREAGFEETVFSKDLTKSRYCPVEHKRAYDKALKLLRKEFSHQQSMYDQGKCTLTWLDFWTKEESLHPERDYVPPKGRTRRSENRGEIVTHWNHSFHNPYGSFGIDINQYMFCDDRSNIYNMNVRGGSIRLGQAKFGSTQSWDAGKMRAKQLFKNLPWRDWEAFLLPNDSDFDWYHDPFTVLSANDKLGSGYNIYIPTMISAEKRKLLAERDRYYGRKLSVEEYMTIGSLKPIDQITMKKFSPWWRNNQSTFDILIKYCRKYPGSGYSLYRQCAESSVQLNYFKFIVEAKRAARAKEKQVLANRTSSLKKPETYRVPVEIELWESEGSAVDAAPVNIDDDETEFVIEESEEFVEDSANDFTDF